MRQKTHVVVLLIRTMLGVRVANSRPNGKKVPIRRMIFFQGDSLQTKHFRLILDTLPTDTISSALGFNVVLTPSPMQFKTQLMSDKKT